MESSERNRSETKPTPHSMLSDTRLPHETFGTRSCRLGYEGTVKNSVMMETTLLERPIAKNLADGDQRVHIE